MGEQDASGAAPDEDIEGADADDGTHADGTATDAEGVASADGANDDGAATGTASATDEEPADEERTGENVVDDERGVDEELVERVEDADPQSIAREIAELRVEIEGLEGQLAERGETIEELESKLARARADFRNYKKRAEKRREEERERATADLVERLLDVHDNLRRALEQDEDAEIRGGVESTLQQFDDALDAEGVAPIEPAPGDEVDPHRHEVLVRVPSDHPEGTVDEVHRVGYEMGGTVVREAQVTVSDGGDEA